MDSIIGITKEDWFKLLKENHFLINARHTSKALVITYLSFINSKVKRQEDKRFGQEIEATQITHPPLFIVGHWRSGTTFLQNMMVHDPHFAYPNMFEVRNPHTFLSRAHLLEIRRKQNRTITRPTDNVMVSIDSPSEEEFAVGVMSLKTPLLGWVFPRRRSHYERYLTFDDVSEAEINEWRFWYEYYFKKLTLKYQKPLLLKSPVNTARIGLLLKLFPDARFVHIHRHPYDVYRSTSKMYRTAVANSAFQNGFTPDKPEYIIDHYTRMYDAFFRDKALIPADHFTEIAFEDLESNTIGTVEKIYSDLNLPGFEQTKEGIERYQKETGPYQKNKFKELDDDIKQRLAKAWHRSFEEWNYQK